MFSCDEVVKSACVSPDLRLHGDDAGYYQDAGKLAHGRFVGVQVDEEREQVHGCLGSVGCVFFSTLL